MTKREDLTGQRFGRLLAVRFEADRWICACDCGREHGVVAASLKRGATGSCGCAKYEPKIHGHASLRVGTRTYRAWIRAKERCYNPSKDGFEHYGGRGIVVCAQWRDSFETFLADMGECPAGLTLGRINNDLPYQPGNCRWETMAQQARNKSVTVRITHQGRTQVQRDWERELGIPRDTISSFRRYYGISGEEALRYALERLEKQNSPRA